MWGFDVLRVGEGGDCIQGRSVNVSYELSTFFFFSALKKPQPTLMRIQVEKNAWSVVVERTLKHWLQACEFRERDNVQHDPPNITLHI